MFQQTPLKRVLFPRTLTPVMVGGFLACLVLFSIVFAIFGSGQASAATNGTINFQARLENAAGNIAADGNYNVQFKMYNASTGGSALWTETYQNSNSQGVTVKNGYLTVSLGSITAFPTTINWDQDLYVTLNIGGTSTSASPTYDGEMNPRLHLTSVPYAFRAGQLAQFNNGNGFTSILQVLQPTSGNQTFQIPDMGAAGTYNVCIANSSACGFALSSGNGNYIQNQIGSAQTSSNFWISGTGRAATALQAPLIDAATASTALNIGTTNANVINLNQNVVVANNKTLTANGNAIFKATTASTTAFQISNTSSTPLINVDSTSLNLVSNSSFEPNITNWSAKVPTAGGGTSTLSQTSSQVFQGFSSLQAITTAANYGVQTSAFTSALATNTQYEVTFMAACSAGLNTFTYGHQDVSGGTANDLNATSTASCNTNWQRYTFHFTTGATITSPNIYMTLGSTASGTFWVDAVQVLQTNNSGVQPYSAGSVKIDGVITDPVVIRNAFNSTNAFEVQDTTGRSNTLVADTANNLVNVGGSLQTGGTTRLDNNGNLSNIGNVTASGNVTQTGSSATNYFMGALGLGTTNPQASSALTIANGKWLSAVDSTGSSYVNMFQVNSNNQIQVGAALNVDGGIVLPADGGRLTVVDEPFGTGITAGTPNSYTLGIGQSNALTVYGENDGSGNAQNVRVAIGNNITPQYTLDVTGDINTTTGFRVNGTAGVGATCSGGQILQNQVVVGGIVTGGTCVSISGSGAVASIGTIDGQPKSANGAVISGGVLYMQSADATNPGLVTTGAQTFAGDKTFQGTVISNTGINTGAGAGTQRIDASGNLSNIGTISAGGNISSGGNITATGQLQGNTLSIGGGAFAVQGSGTVTNFILPVGAETSNTLFSGFLTNELTNYDYRGGAISTAVTGGAAIANANNIIRPASGDTTANVTLTAAGTAQWQLTGISVPVDGRALWTPYLRVRGGQYPSAVQVEYRRSDNTTWDVVVNNTSPVFDGGLWVGPEINYTNYPITGYRITLTYSGTATSYVKEIGLANRNTEFGANNFASIGRANTFYGNLNIANASDLQIAGTSVITSAKVLQNVTANTSILTAGTLGIARGGTGVSTTPTNGQLLIGNGTGYTLGTIGSGSGITVTNGSGTISVAVDSTVCRTTNNCSATGTAGGDLTGSYPNPTIAKLQGGTLTIGTLSGGNLLMYNGSAWVNQSVSGDITISSTGVAAIGNSKVTSAMIADGTVTGTDIANNTITNSDIQSGSFGNITGTGALTSGSIASGFGTISTGNSITTTAALQGGSLVVGTALSGTAMSSTLKVGGGSLATTLGSDINIASFGGTSSNADAFGIHLYRESAGTDWTSAAVVLGRDVDNTTRAGSYLTLGNGASKYVGVDTLTPGYTLDVQGGNGVNSAQGFWVGGTQVITSARVLQNVTTDASILTSGTIASARLSGSYTGITGVGTLTVGAIGSGFGAISTGNNITTSATVQGGAVNATNYLQTNGVTRIDSSGNFIVNDQIDLLSTSASSQIAFNYSGKANANFNFYDGNGGSATSLVLIDGTSGNVNTIGSYQTGGTTRLDNSGNLSNIGTISASGYTNINNGATVQQTLSSSTHAGSIVPDGGFEYGGQHMGMGYTYTVVNNSANAHTGNEYLQATGNSTGQDNWSDVYYQVQPGEQYYAEVWVKADAGMTGTMYPAFFEFTDKDKTNNTWTSVGSTTNPGTTWVKKSGTVTVPAGKYYMRFGTSLRSDSTTGNAYWDDLYISRVDTPAPLTVGGNLTASNGTMILGNTSNGNTITLQSGATASSFALTLPTALGNTGDCLKQTNGTGTLGFGTCSIGTLQNAYDNSGTSNPQILLNSTNGGIKIRDGSTAVSGNLFSVQNNAGTATYLGISATNFTLQDSTGYNSLVFDSTTNHLKVYENVASPTRYVDIYYDTTNNQAVIAASSGTTQVGNGTGNIDLITSGTSQINLTSASTINLLTSSTTSGTIIKTSSNSPVGFQIQNSGSTGLFTVDTQNTQVIIGASSTNGMVISSTGEPTLNGTAQHAKTVVLAAEYPGSVLDAQSDASCVSANDGTMTSGYDGTARANWYNWTTTNSVNECYDVVLQVAVPSDFAGWAASDPLNIQAKTDSTANSSIAIQVMNAAGTVDSNYNYAVGSLGTSWGDAAGSNLAGSYSAGSMMTVRIRMTSKSNANLKLGTLTLNYKSKY